MPYRNVAEAEKKNPGIRGLSPKAKRAWVAAFNSAKAEGKDDEAAAKIAWFAAKRVMTKIQVQDDNLAIGIPFEKIDIKNRTIEGFATLDNIDSSGEIVDFEASRQAFRNWLGNIREMHGPKAVGKALHVEEREREVDGKKYRGMYVKAYISKGAQDTWEKILDGTLKGFSLGGRVLEKRPEIIKSDNDIYARRQVMRITRYTLGELSVVDNPANPLALFDGVERTSLVKFADGALEATDVLADDAPIERFIFYCDTCDVAKVVSDVSDAECPTCPETMIHVATTYERPDEGDIRKMVEEFKDKLSKLQEEAVDDTGKVTKASVNYRVADGGYSCAGCMHYLQNLGKCEKVEYDISANYVCDLFEKRVEPEEIEPIEVYGNVTQKSEMTEEASPLMDEEAEAIEKREFSDKERKRLARQGLALPDGSYPIVTVEDLQNAIRAYGRASDKERVKRWIIRRARALGRTDLLPDEWKVSMSKSEDPDLQMNSKDDTNLVTILDEFINEIVNRINKSAPQAERGGDLETVDKDSLSRILDILKSAIGNVEDILTKAGITRLNDEDAAEVDHVEDVSLPAASADAAPGKVDTDGVGATQETFAETPDETNVLPHAFGKAEGSDEETESLVKAVITEEIGKLAGKLDTAFEAIEQRFSEFAERMEKLENSGAGKKSSEVNVSEELKKSRDSFWGGKFFSGDI
jgi:phage head maturation protease